MVDIYEAELSSLASAKEISKYLNSPLIKGGKGKSVLVISINDTEYMLGYIDKGDVANKTVVYSQFFSEYMGDVRNDLYNNVQNSSDLSTTNSKKERSMLLGRNLFIGARFHDGIENVDYGFNDPSWFVTKDYVDDAGEEAPVAPNKNDEAYFLSLDGGNKTYLSSSGSLQEANAMRFNIGLSGSDIYSYGNWDKTELLAETPIERLERAITEGTYASGARIGFAESGTLHVFNFVDNSSFLMGKGIVEIEKASADNATFSRTIWDANGVTVEVDTDSIITLKVATAELIIDQNNIHIRGATLNYDGDMYVSGLLVVSGTSDLQDSVTMGDSLNVQTGKVQVNSAGKLITTGGNALA